MADKMVAELDRLSVQELTTLIEAAEAKRREKQEEAKVSMVARWKAEAAAAGLSIETLLAGTSGGETGNGRKVRKSQGTKVAPKYRGPNGEEWTGRGKPPKWLTVLEAEGKNRSEFKI